MWTEKREPAVTPPPPQAPSKPSLNEDEVSKKSVAIIEEYIHIYDTKVDFGGRRGRTFARPPCDRRFPTSPVSPQEALQCVQELNSTELLYVFVERGLESTLERSTIARERMGQLLHQLVKASILPTAQYYKGWASWTPEIHSTACK